MIYQDRLQTNLLQLFAHTKFRMVFYNFCYMSTLLLNM